MGSKEGMSQADLSGCGSQGLLGVDYFFPGYAVWAKLIEAAADMGYETNNLVSSLLSIVLLHRRGAIPSIIDLQAIPTLQLQNLVKPVAVSSPLSVW
jgi:hypothetical protein